MGKTIVYIPAFYSCWNSNSIKRYFFCVANGWEDTHNDLPIQTEKEQNSPLSAFSFDNRMSRESTENLIKQASWPFIFMNFALKQNGSIHLILLVSALSNAAKNSWILQLNRITSISQDKCFLFIM